MTRPDVRHFQVALTGTRLARCSDEELLGRLKSRFKLSDAQSRAMLKGACVVKRGMDAASAGKLVTMFGELGLEAVAQEMVAAAALPRPAPHARKPTPASLDALRALADQRLPKPRTSFAYMLGLLLVTLMCIAVPAVYLGFTAAVTYGWLWYLTHIHHHLPRVWQLILLMYSVPGLGGAMVVLFLLRPMFVASPRPREALQLDPEREAGFVSGVHALCRAIGVSPPAEIRLSWDANASVRFRSGWSVFTGQKVLTIGVSLVAGLSARQFVGVMAHEFGHFAQRFGMRCSFFVNSVNRWLEHCAYGEDTWGAKLRGWSDTASAEESGWFSTLVGLSSWVALIAIALTRRLMALLFHASLGLSRYMSRQMEFDADRYEALLAGSNAYRGTACSLRALNHAFEEVNNANIEAWQEHRLLRNLPEAVAAHAREYDATRLAKIEHEIHEQTTTRYWDSHPPDVERIDNAEKRRAPGIYLDETPAALLLKDFPRWAQQVTRQFYAEQGVKFTEDQLRSSDEILGHVRGREQQREQVDRFFNGQFQRWPLLQLAAAKGDAAELGWQDSIDGIRVRSPEIARNWLQAFQAHERRYVLRAAVGLGFTSRQAGLPGAERSPQDLNVELGSIVGRRQPFCKPLDEAFALYARRIDHAIHSLPEPERAHATQLRDALAAMGGLEAEVSAMEEFGGAMSAYGSIAQSSGTMPGGFDKLESTFGELAAKVLARTDRIPQSATPDGTVGGYLRKCCPQVPAAPGKDVSPAELARAAWRVPTAFHHLYMLVLGELVDLCERAERARGIRPIRLVA